jgi:hypothetical protein
MRTLFCFLLLFIFVSCDNSLNRVDKSLVSDSQKLNSPYSNFILYNYHVESSMSFGSGFDVIQILNSKEKCDYTSNDYFRLDNNSPFFIKWKSKDTLLIKCVLDGSDLSSKQPLKKEIKKWKDWTFEVEYYSVYAVTAEIKFAFNSYSIDNSFITFKSKEDTLVFKNDEVQISLDTNNIFLTQFKVDTFNSKLGLSFSHYDFQNNYNKNDFLKQQAFLKVKP